MTTKEEWIEKDLKYVWHPDTQMKQYEGADFKPVLIEKGKGIYLYDSDGNSYIDGVSSWWVNTLGHSNPKLNGVLTEQAKKIVHNREMTKISEKKRRSSRRRTKQDIYKDIEYHDEDE